MESAELVREVRRGAGLSQRELAELVGTSQPTLAAYENGSKQPKLATLASLAAACGYDLSLSAVPRTRVGALSLRGIAASIAEGPLSEREQLGLRLLFGFADDFRESSRAGQRWLIAEEPSEIGDRRLDALLAAAAEFFAGEAGVPVPAWTTTPNRFVRPFWFVASRPGLVAYVIARTPGSFARHGVFLAREVFDRA